MRHTLAILALLAVTTSPATGASSVTTNTYDASSLSDDIALSCKDLKITTQANVQGHCNSIQDSQQVLTKSTVDVDDHVQCGMQSDGKIRIEWGTALDYAGSTMQNPAVKLDSTGKKYLFEADCAYPADSTVATTDQTVELSDTTNGLKNTGATGGAMLKR